MALLLTRLPAETQGQLVALASRLGAEGFERYTAEIADRLLAEVGNEARTEEARLETARQFVTFRRDDAGAAADLIALITPQASPTFAAGLVSA
ncbi:hypothetical protein AB1L30_00050, partial [Bremerella sp. JC817]